MTELSELFNQLVKKNTPDRTNKIGHVIAVDKKNKTCDVKLISGGELLDVRLTAVVDNGKKKFLMIPELDSSVLCSPVLESNVDYFVSAFSDIQEVIFQDGFNKGMVKVKELTERLNLIETAFNSLKNEFIKHIHPISGPSTGTVTPPPLVENLTKTKIQDLENKNFSH